MKYRIVPQGSAFAVTLHEDDGTLHAWVPETYDFRKRRMDVPARTDAMVCNTREDAVAWARQRGAGEEMK